MCRSSMAAPRAPTRICATRFALRHTQFFGVSHQMSIRTRATELVSLQISIPIAGTLKTLSQRGGRCVRPGEAIVYLPGDPINLDWSDQCKALIVTIDASEFERRLGQHFNFQLRHIKLDDAVVQLGAGAGLGFANTVSLLLNEAENPESPLINGITTESFEDMLLANVGNLIVAQQPPSALRNRRPGMPGCVKRAVDYIEQNAHLDIGIADLTTVSRVSLRSLQNGFAKQFNTGPMTFVKQVKLRRVRDELLAACPEETLVIDVASKWGFFHQSNFAQNYLRYFGELPSETLRRPRD